MTEYVKPFKIFEYINGRERIFNKDEVQTKISYFANVIKENDINGLVAIDIGRSANMIYAVISLLANKIPFIFLPPNVTATEIGVNWILQEDEVIKVETETKTILPDDICYCIRTSGSTGEPKMVWVPVECIMLNMEDFIARFDIKPEDNILFSTSVYFDPSIVEIFFCILTGATMTLVGDNIRSNPNQLLNIVDKFECSVVQITPAVMRLMSDSSLRSMLSEKSPIRILMIGGEKFPLDLVKSHRSRFNKTRIFNVYGITEVSCWASAFEVEFECEEVLISGPVKGTFFYVDEDNQLFLGGRKCWINGSLTEELTATGDIVEWSERRKGWKIVGRTDDQVKINGIRCHLSQLSDKIMNFEKVEFARLVLYKDFLILFVKLSNISVFDKDELSSVLPPLLKPARVIIINQVPVNNNGKVDTPTLLRLVNSENKEDSVRKFLDKNNIYGLDTEKSFVDYGIDSLKAAELALLFGDASYMTRILSPDLSIAEILKELWNGDIGMQRNEIIEERDLVRYIDFYQPTVLWAYNTEKCIDGAPLVLRASSVLLAVVASHSGCLAAINVETGQLCWKHKFPTRFEAGPSSCAGMLAIGGYNGIIYILNLEDGTILHQLQVEDTVKAPVTFSNDRLFVISYKPAIYCFESSNCSLLFKQSISGGSPSTPLVYENTVICTTIKGTVETFTEAGDVRWKTILDAPVFSNAIVDGISLLATTVSSRVYKLDLDTGNVITVVDLNEGPLFAPISLEIDNVYIASSQKGTVAILSSKNLTVIRRLTFPDCSFVRAPKYYSEEKIAITSTNGWLLVLNRDVFRYHGSAIAVRCRLASGEVFAAADCSSDFIISGSRDDWIRCMDKLLFHC